MNILRKIYKSLFCNHNYKWLRNVYGDEIYRTGKFKRSYHKCKNCGKLQSKENLNLEKT